MVKPGKLSDAKDEEYITKILIERRDLIGRYWFHQSNPLDAFDIKGNRLVFEDLAIQHGFQPEQGSTYHIDVIAVNGKKKKKLMTLNRQSPSLDLGEWFQQNENPHATTFRDKFRRHRQNQCL